MKVRSTRKQFRIQLEPEVIERLEQVASMISGSMTGQKLAADLIRDSLPIRAQVIAEKMPEIRQAELSVQMTA